MKSSTFTTLTALSLVVGNTFALTETAVCNRWIADYPEQAPNPIWTTGGTGCDPGTLSSSAEQDALRRINLFRWMMGLEEASYSASRADKCAQCALMSGKAGTLNHYPPTSWECYTSDGDTACGNSNLAGGVARPAMTVDAYLVDYGVESLGHRRWAICPPLDNVGFGHYDCTAEQCAYGRWGCMWVIGGDNTRPSVDLKFPAETWPIDALRGSWSFATTSSLSSASLQVTHSGQTVQTVFSSLDAGACSGYNWIKWEIDSPEVGDYHVQITASGGTWSYTVSLAECGTPPPSPPTPRPTWPVHHPLPSMTAPAQPHPKDKTFVTGSTIYSFPPDAPAPVPGGMPPLPPIPSASQPVQPVPKQQMPVPSTNGTPRPEPSTPTTRSNPPTGPTPGVTTTPSVTTPISTTPETTTLGDTPTPTGHVAGPLPTPHSGVHFYTSNGKPVGAFLNTRFGEGRVFMQCGAEKLFYDMCDVLGAETLPLGDAYDPDNHLALFVDKANDPSIYVTMSGGLVGCGGRDLCKGTSVNGGSKRESVFDFTTNRGLTALRIDDLGGLYACNGRSFCGDL